MTTRAERMQQRMRGAGHGQVEDVSFQLDFGGDDTSSEIEPPQQSPESPESPDRPPPRTTPTPNTSAKRKRLDGDSSRVVELAPGSTRQTSRQSLGKPDPYEIQESSTESAQPPAEQSTTSPNAVTQNEDPDSVESLPPPRPSAPAPPISPVLKKVLSDNVEDSQSTAVASSARLQAILSPEDNPTETVPISSPLERKVRRTTASTRRSTLNSRGSRESGISLHEDIQKLSLDSTQPEAVRTSSLEPPSRDGSTLEQSDDAEHRPEAEIEREPESEPESIVDQNHEQSQNEDESLAEEVDAQEAAQQLGRKRPRRSPRRSSAEADSTIADDDQEGPLPKRRKKQPPKSPAKQKHGKPKEATKAKASPPKGPRRKKKKSSSDAPGDEELVSIPVQRFTKRAQIQQGEDDSADALKLDIPFANRGGVNPVDVLTQVCDEIIGASLDTLKEGVRNAEDASTKREYRVKKLALEAYQEEVRNRLLQHTLLLDALHSLRKRVRSAQKERTGLRDEIMRIRAERDQVALRKDAVRMKHGRVKEEALNQLSLSSQMHDIDLAVDRGRAAPELSAAEKKKAELANLEILISRITDQACTQSGAGGTLRQIKDFNAFLERAAVALEGR